MANCGACGVYLTHIDEACPNCLPQMADRPPVHHFWDPNQGGSSIAEREVTREERRLNAADDEITQLKADLAELEGRVASWMADARRYALVISKLKPKVRDLEGQLAEYIETIADGVMAVTSLGADLQQAEKREAVLRKALDKAQTFIEEKCNSGADNEGWLMLIPEDVSKLWQMLETALEVK